MIAIAIVSFMLAGAYGVTTRNTRQIRQAQERTEAQKLNAASVEQLAVILNSSTPNANLDSGEVTCFSSGNLIKAALAPAVTTIPALGAMNFGAYTTNCKNGTGTSYYTLIVRSVDTTSYHDLAGNPETVTTYTVHTRWQKLGGGEAEEVTFTYRASK